MKAIFILFLVFLLSAFTPNPYSRLSWELDAPERQPWSHSLQYYIEKNLDTLSSAKDILYFCPRFLDMTKVEKIRALSELMVADAYYESSWNPKVAVVDVGTRKDKNTWSVGLWQMSVVDQRNYRLDYGFSFKDLKNPHNNAKLAITILSTLVKKHGYIARKPGGGSYWSTLRPNTKAKDIALHVRELEFCNYPPPY